MFTGLVREIGRLHSLRATGGVTELEISAPRSVATLTVGDSIAVNGICLTVTAVAGARLRADVSAETRRVSTVRGWRPGDPVHLEPAVRAGEEMGGHFVLGHVDGVGRVSRLARRAGTIALTVSTSPSISSRLLPKGSIAVDGVSLTLDEGPFSRGFTVTLVPHTLGATRFAQMRPGTLVNLEVDVLSKAAARAGGTAAQQRPAALSVDAILGRGWSRH